MQLLGLGVGMELGDVMPTSNPHASSLAGIYSSILQSQRKNSCLPHSSNEFRSVSWLLPQLCRMLWGASLQSARPYPQVLSSGWVKIQTPIISSYLSAPSFGPSPSWSKEQGWIGATVTPMLIERMAFTYPDYQPTFLVLRALRSPLNISAKS